MNPTCLAKATRAWVGLTLAGVATFALSVGSADTTSAATFNGGFEVSGTALSDPGLVIEVDPVAGLFSHDLEVGESATFDLFDIWTNEVAVNYDDTIPQTLEVAFNFTDPVTSGFLDGETSGFYGVVQYGMVTWDNPLLFNFGSDDSGILALTLSEEFFNYGLFGTNAGQQFGATVEATLTYIQAPVLATPVPAALPLFATALAGIGFVGWRRKRLATT